MKTVERVSCLGVVITLLIVLAVMALQYRHKHREYYFLDSQARIVARCVNDQPPHCELVRP